MRAKPMRRLFPVALLAIFLSGCAGSASPPPLRLSLPDVPSHLRINPGVTKIPSGTLDSRQTMRLIADLRRSELRHSRRGDQILRHSDVTRRAYSSNLRKAPK